MRASIQQTRNEKAQAAAEHARSRLAAERRLQLLALLMLAALVLVGMVLYAGVRNVFLPGWWRLG